MEKMSTMDMVSMWLLIIGGLNWGLSGIGYFVKTNLNVVNLIFGSMPLLENIVYLLVGVAAIMAIMMAMKK
ncbi:MAG: DUF378 domain-containing protein [Candidatus Micrarchaeota archaeon]|mgnify:CR=1 FL=1